jgi:hypothetical protein
LIPNCAVRVAASRDRGLIDPHDLRMSAVFSQCPKEMQYPLNVRVMETQFHAMLSPQRKVRAHLRPNECPAVLKREQRG